MVQPYTCPYPTVSLDPIPSCIQPRLPLQQIYIIMGASAVVSRKSLSASPSPPPRTMEEYMRAIDRALAARYLQELRARNLKRNLAVNTKSTHTQTPSQLLMPRLVYISVRVLIRFTDSSFRVDLCECPSSDGTPSRVIATFELPGMKKTDLILEVRNGWLLVEGERRPPVLAQQRIPARRRISSSDTPAEQKNLSPRSLAKLLNVDQPDESALMDEDPTAKTDRHHSDHSISEIRYGRFRRTIKLPSGIEVSHHSILRHTFY
jgi:HSP20 family molecular chaperone IbpA